MMRKMGNKKSTSQESLSGECASTQDVHGIIVDCDTILNDASVQGDESKEMHYIYLVRCSDDSLYCGWTTDLKRRIDAHNGHILGGAKYTRGRRPVTLVYAESFHQKQEAQRREYAIKRMTKTKKLRLIKGAK
ncbi:GIY-YIG catalytic domain protein [Veillonella parvula]|nr:GIY-YIG catalytic domain protein [Veillonella parvula]